MGIPSAPLPDESSSAEELRPDEEQRLAALAGFWAELQKQGLADAAPWLQKHPLGQQGTADFDVLKAIHTAKAHLIDLGGGTVDVSVSTDEPRIAIIGQCKVGKSSTVSKVMSGALVGGTVAHGILGWLPWLKGLLATASAGSAAAGVAYSGAAISPIPLQGRNVGDDLEASVRQKPLPPAAACQVTKAVAEILDNLHRGGLYHGDIQPRNLIIQEEGTIALVDTPGLQGGAKRNADVGNVDYLAPEQLFGDNRDATAGSDLYGLGCTFYFLLTKSPPFWLANTFAEKLEAQRSGQPIPLRQWGIPDTVSAVVTRLMAKNPGDRYASARDVIAEMDAVELSKGSGGQSKQ